LHFVNFGRLGRNQSFSHGDGLAPAKCGDKARIKLESHIYETKLAVIIRGGG
jgi:hypothetical protein